MHVSIHFYRFGLIKTVTMYVGLLLVVLLIGCGGKDYIIKDLQFFNVKGPVKQFAELKVLLDDSSNADFEKYAKLDVNYYLHHFSRDGQLTKVDNINPSPYALHGFTITINRAEDSLIIQQQASKEIYTRTYRLQNDTLSMATYNKLDDEVIDYHSEKYKKYLFTKDGAVYTMKGYMEGVTPKDLFDQRNYTVVKNKNGYDSLVYLVGSGARDTTLVYAVTYALYDQQHNWLKRQFHRPKNAMPLSGFLPFSEYRKIEYYE